MLVLKSDTLKNKKEMGSIVQDFDLVILESVFLCTHITPKSIYLIGVDVKFVIF